MMEVCKVIILLCLLGVDEGSLCMSNNKHGNNIANNQEWQ